MIGIGGWLSREAGTVKAQTLVRMAGLSRDTWGCGFVGKEVGLFVSGNRTEAELFLVCRDGKILLRCPENEAPYAAVTYDTARGQLTLEAMYYEQGREVLWFASDPRALPGWDRIQCLPTGKSALFMWR